MHNQEIYNKRIDNIYQLLETTNRNLEKIKDMLKNLEKDEQRDKYRDMEGVSGTFDGVNLVPAEGAKMEVPANYAAKSRLVYGDTLKLINEDGKQVFKQIEKVDRKKVAGILTKKEGKWYIISDSGTYKVSDIAAEFQHAELNDEAEAFVPSSNLNVLYAALDKVNKKLEKIVSPVDIVARKPSGEALSINKPAVVQLNNPKPVTAPQNSRSRPNKPFKKSGGRPAPKKPFTQGPKREFVADIVEKTNKSEKVTLPEPISLADDDLR